MHPQNPDPLQFLDDLTLAPSIIGARPQESHRPLTHSDLKRNSKNLLVLCDAKLEDLEPEYALELLLSIPDLARNSYVNYCHKADGVTALHRASFRGNLEAVDIMLRQRGIDVSLKDKRGEDALMKGAIAGQAHIVERLLSAGADVNSTDEEGLTVFYRAALAGQMAVLDTLAEDGANVDARDSHGCTALHIAVVNHRADVVGVVVDLGASLTAGDKKGNTALHKAVAAKDLDSITILLDAGADPYAENKAGLSPIDIARKVYFDDIEELLDHHWSFDAGYVDGFDQVIPAELVGVAV